jgi:citrate lyase alpha subunit
MKESLSDQLALIRRHLDRATAALATSGSEVARAVLGEFERKLEKAAAAMPSANAQTSRELIVEVEQAGDSAKVAADADSAMSTDARKLVAIAHNAICVLKAETPTA